MAVKILYKEPAPRFRSRKAYIKEKYREHLNLIEWGKYADLDKVVSVFENSHQGATEFISIALRARFICFADLRYSLAEHLEQCKPLGNSFAHLVLKSMLLTQISFYNYERLRREFIRTGRDDSPPTLETPATVGNVVAFIAVFGNKELFVDCLFLAQDLFDIGAVGTDVTPLSQLFILRLSERFLGIQPRMWSEDKFPWAVDPLEKESLLAELWNSWDTVDMSLIEDLLLQLANWHTYQASRNNKDGGRDFEGHAEQYPIAVHFIMRLRQWHGLENPQIKHRLLEPPFDRLPEPLVNLEFSDEVKRVMDRARIVIPDFDEVVNQAKRRDWSFLL